ncbi:MAG: hypothetical protein GX361_03850 [Bacteroidales bacterium]|nr:hypothetical protein [Bacteroidales bacterium]
MKKITLAILCLITMAWAAVAQTDEPKAILQFDSTYVGQKYDYQKATLDFTYARDEADAEGKKIYIDWGDGVKQEINDQNKTPIQIVAIAPDYQGGVVKIYAPKLYKFKASGLVSLDVTNAPELEDLEIGGGGSELDLSKNVNLNRLRITGLKSDIDFTVMTKLEILILNYGTVGGVLDLSNSPNIWKIDVTKTRYSELKLSPEATFVKDGVLGELYIRDNMFQTCELNRIINEYIPEPTTDKDGNQVNIRFNYDGNPGMHGVNKITTKAKTFEIHNYGEGRVRCGDDIVKLKDTPDVVLTVEPDHFFSFDIITMEEITYEKKHGSYRIQVDWGDGELVEYCTGNTQLSGKGNVTGYSKGSEIKFYLENKAVTFNLVETTQRQPGDGNVHIIKADFSNNPELLSVSITVNYWNEQKYSALKDVVFAPESYDLSMIQLEGDLDACVLNKIYEILPEAAEEGYGIELLGGAWEAMKTSNTKILYDKGWEKFIEYDKDWNSIEINGDNSAVCDDTSVEEITAREWGIRSEGSSLLIPTVIGDVVTVYNALGAKIAETVATAEETRINGLTKNQIVIVRAGDRSAKVIL